MADNLTVNTPGGQRTLATLDEGDVHYQRVILSTPVAAYGAVPVGAAATLIVAASPSRRGLVVRNHHLTNTLYVGDNDQVTEATGFPVPAGESLTFDFYSGAVYGIAASTTDVRFLEEG